MTKVVRDFGKCYLVGNFRGVEVWDGTGLHFITSKLQKDTGARHKKALSAARSAWQGPPLL